MLFPVLVLELPLLIFFHSYQGVPQTKFSERIFGVLDMDGSGALDFFEFSVGVRYCSLSCVGLYS